MKIFIARKGARTPAPVVIVKYKKDGKGINDIRQTFFAPVGDTIVIEDVEYKGTMEELYEKLEQYYMVSSYYETSIQEYKRVQVLCIGTAIAIGIARKLPENKFEMLISGVVQEFTSGVSNLQKANVWELAGKNGFLVKILSARKFPKDDIAQKESAKPSELSDIMYDEQKKVVIVSFKDGTKIVKHCHEEDDFDVEVGVALAIAKRMFGTTTNFKKYVSRKARNIRQNKKLNKEKNNG